MKKRNEDLMILQECALKHHHRCKGRLWAQHDDSENEIRFTEASGMSLIPIWYPVKPTHPCKKVLRYLCEKHYEKTYWYIRRYGVRK